MPLRHGLIALLVLIHATLENHLLILRIISALSVPERTA